MAVGIYGSDVWFDTLALARREATETGEDPQAICWRYINDEERNRERACPWDRPAF